MKKHFRFLAMFLIVVSIVGCMAWGALTCNTGLVEINTWSWDYAPTIAYTFSTCGWFCDNSMEHVYWSGQDPVTLQPVIYGRIRTAGYPYTVSFQGIVVRPSGATCDIADPTVIRVGGLWHMYFGGAPTSPCNPLNTKIFGATSWDGINWVYMNGGQPVVDLGPRTLYGVGQPSAVLLDNGIIRMYYTDSEGPYGGGTYVAESIDGEHFTTIDLGRRVFEGGTPGWSPVVAKHGLYNPPYRAVFVYANNTHYLATSYDGFAWNISGTPLCGGDDLDGMDRWEDGSMKYYVSQISKFTFGHWKDNGAPPEQNPNLSNWKLFRDYLLESLFPLDY